MVNKRTDIDKFTDEEILKKFKEDSGTEKLVVNDALRQALPSFREMCKARDFTLEEGISEVSALITGQIIQSGLIKCGRTVRGNVLNIN